MCGVCSLRLLSVQVRIKFVWCRCELNLLDAEVNYIYLCRRIKFVVQVRIKLICVGELNVCGAGVN